MNKFLGIITTVGIISAIILLKINFNLSIEIALGSFILWIGWTAFHDEEVNHGR